jgi:predicted transcriptional regulator
MTTVENLRDSLIDKLLSISSEEYLVALNQLVEKSDLAGEPVKLTEQQIMLLKLSDEDIEAGRLIPHEELYKNMLAWLKEK